MLSRYCAGPAAAFGAPPPFFVPVVAPPKEFVAPPDPIDALSLTCLRRGRGAAEAGRLPEALAWFDRALVLDPDLGIGHFCRAMVLADLGRADDARDALEASLGRAPDDFAARIQFARLLARHGHYDGSLRVLGPALQAKPHLARKMLDDRDFRAMRDHPHFLAMIGAI